ncbi:uncharacterized protein G2W53_019492 [Senna tora]|uniref:Uncharacterized protein n=1 Tax=Senna tora TaxID=362788 RepID=A0A834TTR7_9FABA|nr:uncharacterized protein G2W53_019492 [Senna tora]
MSPLRPPVPTPPKWSTEWDGRQNGEGHQVGPNTWHLFVIPPTPHLFDLIIIV